MKSKDVRDFETYRREFFLAISHMCDEVKRVALYKKLSIQDLMDSRISVTEEDSPTVCDIIANLLKHYDSASSRTPTSNERRLNWLRKRLTRTFDGDIEPSELSPFANAVVDLTGSRDAAAADDEVRSVPQRCGPSEMRGTERSSSGTPKTTATAALEPAPATTRILRERRQSSNYSELTTQEPQRRLQKRKIPQSGVTPSSKRSLLDSGASKSEHWGRQLDVDARTLKLFVLNLPKDEALNMLSSLRSELVSTAGTSDPAQQKGGGASTRSRQQRDIEVESGAGEEDEEARFNDNVSKEIPAGSEEPKPYTGPADASWVETAIRPLAK